MISTLITSKIINKDGRINPHIKNMIASGEYDHIIKQIYATTNFLDETSTLKERIHCIFNNINTTNQHACRTCGGSVKFSNDTNSYNKYCSQKCIASNPDIQAKRKANQASITEKTRNTWIEKYGYYGNLCNKDILQKTHNTQNEVYGGAGFQSDVIRNKAAKVVLEMFGMGCAANTVENKIKSNQSRQV